MKYRIALLALALAVPQFAHAMPGLPEALSQVTPHSWDSQPQGCTSFEGTWKGSCTAGNVKSPEETTVIKQSGCYALQTGNDFQPIGGLSSVALTFPIADKGVVSVSAVGALDWNADKTALNFQFGGLARKVGASQLTSINGSGSTHIEGNKLLVDMTVMGTKASCVYEKQ